MKRLRQIVAALLVVGVCPVLASAQTGGYLVLVAAGFIEWQLTGGGRRTPAGLVQIALLFVSGLLLAFSLLLAAQLGPDLSQALPAIATILSLIGAPGRWDLDDPDQVSALLDLGKAYWQGGQRGEALGAFRRVLELQPGQTEALRYLLNPPTR